VRPLDLVGITLAGALGALVTVLALGADLVLIVPVALVVAGIAYVVARDQRAHAGPAGDGENGWHAEEHVTTGH
jgi:ABC-type uncharacterized transport system permease subunit